jgi:cytochrome P450
MTAIPKIAPELAAHIVDPVVYGNWRALLDTFATLRRESPVAVAEIPGYRPFWVITRHADILKISKDNATFLNNPATVVVAPLMAETFVAHLMKGSPHLVKSLVQMDAPEHPKYRRLTQDWFMPANLKTIESNIRAIAKSAKAVKSSTVSSMKVVGFFTALKLFDLFWKHILSSNMGHD